MTAFVILIAFFAFSLPSHGSVLQELCPEDGAKAELVSDWKKIDAKQCAVVKCTHQSFNLERKKCLATWEFENTPYVSYEEFGKKNNALILHQHGIQITLYPGIQCYEECLPQERT